MSSLCMLDSRTQQPYRLPQSMFNKQKQQLATLAETTSVFWRVARLHGARCALSSHYLRCIHESCSSSDLCVVTNGKERNPFVTSIAMIRLPIYSIKWPRLGAELKPCDLPSNERLQPNPSGGLRSENSHPIVAYSWKIMMIIESHLTLGKPIIVAHNINIKVTSTAITDLQLRFVPSWTYTDSNLDLSPPSVIWPRNLMFFHFAN